ncbi:MAG: twin-arginine translocation signal domain-containing protein, partial [Gammaproteobacteria bacterium]
MKHEGSQIHSLTRRQFLVGAAVLAASIGPLRGATRHSPTTISVDLHSHAFLSVSEMDGFSSSIGPDVSFLSGHHKMGSMPSLFKAVKKNKIIIARTPADILRAKSLNRRVVILAHEGGYILNGDLSKLEKLN